MAEDSRQAGALFQLETIEVTLAMVEAGMEELREFTFGDDPAYVLESVFRAMAYKSPSASRMISDK